MEALTPGHLLVLLIGCVLLFGYQKLPDASRSLGRSLRIFRSEMQSVSEPTERMDGATGAASPGAAGFVARLEAEAAAAEAQAAELRERVRKHSARTEAAS